MKQAYLAGAGWIDFCPTKQHHRQPQISFVSVLRWAPKHVLPLWGTYEGSPGSFLGMDVTVNVTEVAG